MCRVSFRDRCLPLPQLWKGSPRGRAVRDRGAGRGWCHWVVFRGTDVTTGDAVAIKEVMLGGLADGKSRELALREARVLRQLHHAAIPAWRDEVTLGVGRSAALYLVQDFEDGVDLQEGLVAHRWSEREVLEVMHEVLGALEYLHGLHPPVIHRDIKPANLIRRTDGSLALVDFGAVRDALRSSQGGGQTVAGTFGFMAPEQFAGQAEPRSDLYALGMTAVALLSRKAPALLHDRAGQLAWEPVVSVSSRTTVLLRSLLQPDPALRPVSAAVVRQTIEQILASGEAVSPGRSNHSTSEPVSAQGRPTRLPVAEAELRAGPVHQPELEDHALIRGQDAPGAGLAAREGASVAQRRTDSTTWGVAMALAFLVCVSIGIALKFAPTNSPPATTPAPPPVSAPARSIRCRPCAPGPSPRWACQGSRPAPTKAKRARRSCRIPSWWSASLSPKTFWLVAPRGTPLARSSRET